MEMHIRKGLHDQLITVIPQRRIGILPGQRIVNTDYDAVLQHQISVFRNVHPAQCRRMDDMAF